MHMYAIYPPLVAERRFELSIAQVYHSKACSFSSGLPPTLYLGTQSFYLL